MHRQTRVVCTTLLLTLGTWACVEAADQPEGAHIRAALGSHAARNLGVARGHISAWVDRQDGTWLEIQAYEFLDEDTEATLFLALPNPRSGNRWKLGPSGDGAWARYTIHDIRPEHVISYGTNRQHGGSIVLRRFDERTRTIEGTFAFVGVAGSESLNVREGSFELRYDTAEP